MKLLTLGKASILSLLILPVLAFAQEGDIPTDIENLTGEALDASVTLSWDPAIDDGVILGHKVYYDTMSINEMAEDDYYQSELLTESSDSTYMVDGLTNGTTYYFSVTALDEEGNESYSYSNEVALTPSSGLIDTPSVISARQISDSEIEVIMSKPIVVKSITQAFSIMEEGNMANEVYVQNVEVSDTYVYIEVEDGMLSNGVTYEVTATSAVEDLDGNPVSSGITDTVTFTSVSGGDNTFINEDPIVEVNDDILFEDDYGNDDFLDIPEDNYYDETNNHSSAIDRIPPSEVTGLSMDSSQISSKGIVTLSWQPAADVDGDIVDQILYTKEGHMNWDNGYSLGKTTNREMINVKKDMTYGVRIVTIDRSGNESNGAVLNFTTNLSKTGPTGLYLFGGAVLVAIFFFMSRRRPSF